MVKLPVDGVVLPIGPGAAMSAVTPAPERVPVKLPVVNAPVDAVVLPIGPGAANLFVKPTPDTAPEAASVENEPVDGVVAPRLVPLIAPPEIATVGAVRVPVLVGLFTGKNCPAMLVVVSNVPVVGKVTVVEPVAVNVTGKAPENVTGPPITNGKPNRLVTAVCCELLQTNSFRLFCAWSGPKHCALAAVGACARPKRMRRYFMICTILRLRCRYS